MSDVLGPEQCRREGQCIAEGRTERKRGDNERPRRDFADDDDAQCSASTRAPSATALRSVTARLFHYFAQNSTRSVDVKNDAGFT